MLSLSNWKPRARNFLTSQQDGVGVGAMDENETLRLRLWDAERTLGRITCELESLEAQVLSCTHLAVEVEALRRRLQLLTNSTSWRATAPLRQASRAAKIVFRWLRQRLSRFATRRQGVPASHGSLAALPRESHLETLTGLELSILEQLRRSGHDGPIALDVSG